MFYRGINKKSCFFFQFRESKCYTMSKSHANIKLVTRMSKEFKTSLTLHTASTIAAVPDKGEYVSRNKPTLESAANVDQGFRDIFQKIAQSFIRAPAGTVSLSEAQRDHRIDTDMEARYDNHSARCCMCATTDVSQAYENVLWPPIQLDQKTNPITITTARLDGRKSKITLSRDTLCGTLLAVLAQVRGFSSCEVRLVFKGAPMNYAMSLHSERVIDGDTIHVIQQITGS